MPTEKPGHSKLFFTIAAISSAFALLWLILTPSKSTNLVLLSYSVERLILIVSIFLLTLIFLICAQLKQKIIIKNIYSQIVKSKSLFFVLLAFGLILLILFFGTLLGYFEPWNIIFKRILPVIVLGLFLSVEIIIFQQIDGEGLPRLTINNLVFPDSGHQDYIQSNGRDLRLDFLRGFFVFVMIVDHIADKSPLYFITFGGNFFTSAAEGFFLISGIVAGLVYFKVIQRKGLWSAIKKSWLRAITIYLVTISLSLFVLLSGRYIQPSLIDNIQPGSPVQMLIGLILFKSSYYLSHVLIIYALLFLIFPLALLLLHYKKTWILFLVSITYYAISQVFPSMQWFPIYTFMDMPGVILLFTIGVTLGYHHILEYLQKKINKKWLLYMGISFVLLLFLWNLVNPGISNIRFQLPITVVDKILFFFDKPSVAPGRFLASFITFGFLYLVVTFAWTRIKKFFGWLMLPFGENSLIAYAIHVILCVGYIIISSIVTYGSDSFWLNGLFQLIGVMVTWVLVKTKLFSPTLEMRKFYYAIPLVLIITYFVLSRTV